MWTYHSVCSSFDEQNFDFSVFRNEKKANECIVNLCSLSESFKYTNLSKCTHTHKYVHRDEKKNLDHLKPDKSKVGSFSWLPIWNESNQVDWSKLVDVAIFDVFS